jgi:hypothetical protein
MTALALALTLLSVPVAVPDLCSLDGGRWCVKCPAGGCPDGLGTIPYVCCYHVSGGDDFCVSVEFAGDCENGVLGQCDWGQTNADGSVTCYD